MRRQTAETCSSVRRLTHERSCLHFSGSAIRPYEKAVAATARTAEPCGGSIGLGANGSGTAYARASSALKRATEVLRKSLSSESGGAGIDQ